MRYAAVGVANTALHWALFFLFFSLGDLPQAWSNFLAFLCAATFSFFINARFTFRAASTRRRYVMFVGFMAAMSYLFGYAGDVLQGPPVAVLALFSGFSLVLGFLFSRFVVFR
ncbi:GtrA family protein [Kerstersia similis]|uniref:GtrA family protein n=1 Tax=Kerstersia similis TaxID=206505 RepID=UPI0039EFF40D